MNSCGLHCRHLLTRSSLPTSNNRTRVTHPTAGRRGLSANETDDRLRHIRLDVCRRLFFCSASDFTDHDDTGGFGILIEQFDRIDEVRSDDWIAANADTRGLA